MYYLFVLGKFLALILPRDVCYFIAKILALFKFYISYKDREAVRYNLSIVVCKEKINKYIKEVFINFSYYLVDFFRYSKLNLEFIKKYVKVSGLEYIDKCKGAIILTAHLGNYELGGAVFSILGFPLYAFALSHRDKRLNKFFNYQRESVGIKVIPVGKSIKKSILILKEAKFLAVLADRDFSNSGIKVKMFSKYAVIPRGPAFLALASKVNIIPAFFIRKNKKFYHLIFDSPIVLNETSTEEDLINSYVKVLEKYIKNYPEQWYMFEKYWLEE